MADLVRQNEELKAQLAERDRQLAEKATQLAGKWLNQEEALYAFNRESKRLIGEVEGISRLVLDEVERRIEKARSALRVLEFLESELPDEKFRELAFAINLAEVKRESQNPDNPYFAHLSAKKKELLEAFPITEEYQRLRKEKMEIDRSLNQLKLWEIEDEAKMIEMALAEIEKIDETIIGYNNLKFDVPFMLERLRILGKGGRKYWNIHYKKWFDLYQYLGNDYRSLRTWLRRANIKGKHPELNGKDIPRCFSSKDFQKIVSHNVDDLVTSEKLFKFLKKRNPELIPFE